MRDRILARQGAYTANPAESRLSVKGPNNFCVRRRRLGHRNRPGQGGSSGEGRGRGLPRSCPGPSPGFRSRCLALPMRSPAPPLKLQVVLPPIATDSDHPITPLSRLVTYNNPTNALSP
jgi:hypothetical protein